jgi:hypothetical protein
MKTPHHTNQKERRRKKTLKYGLVGERIGGWCSILKVRSNIFGDRFGNEVLKVMLRFCLVDMRLLVAYLLPLPLSYPKKESWQAQGRKQKPIRIRICEFVYFTNLLIRLDVCEFIVRLHVCEFV